MRVSPERREEDRGEAVATAHGVDAGLLESPPEHDFFMISDSED